MKKKNPNPFQELLPENGCPEQEIKQEVMGTIHLKRFLFQILELFTAILGITLAESMAIPNAEPKKSISKH